MKIWRKKINPERERIKQENKLTISFLSLKRATTLTDLRREIQVNSAVFLNLQELKGTEIERIGVAQVINELRTNNDISVRKLSEDIIMLATSSVEITTKTIPLNNDEVEKTTEL